MSEGLDLFGGHAIEDIPEDNNLPVGVYSETIIDSAKAMKANSGMYGIGINYKDISEDGFGLSAFQWLSIPAPANRAQFLLRDLKAIGLTGEQMVAIARNVKGTDPETAEVNINGINDVLADVTGRMGVTTVTGYINKRTGQPGTNVTFALSDTDDASFSQNSAMGATNRGAEKTNSSAETADTSNWFG